MVFLNLLELEEQYNDILISTSRGFGLGHEFLDIWVPGISKEESIKNFFEAVKLYNVEKDFGLRIDKKNIEENELKKIASASKKYEVIVEDEVIKIKSINDKS